MMFFLWHILEKAANMNEKLRQETLSILFKNFGDDYTSNRRIYECADEWVSKYNTTSGLVNYYKTYYNNAK